MENRYSYNNCSFQLADEFVRRLTAEGYQLKAHKPADSEIMQDRYTLCKDGERISIVLETKAETLILTARPELIDEMKRFFTAVKSASAARMLPTIKYKEESALAAPPNKNLVTNIKNQNLSKKENGNVGTNNIDKKKILSENEFSKERSKAAADNENVKDSGHSLNKDKTTRNNGIRAEKAISNSQSVEKNTGKANNKLSAAGSVQKDHNKNNVPKSALKKITSANGGLNQDKQQTTASAKNSITLSNEEGLNDVSKAEEGRDSNNKIKPSAPDRRVTSPKAAPNNVQELSEEVKEPLYKNGFSIKKFSPERLKLVLKKIKKSRLMNYKLVEADGEVNLYTVSDKKAQKVYLRYVPLKQTLQLQGKRSELFSELQLMIADDSDFKTVVSSHIQLTGEEKHAGEMQRLLKKRLPDAFGYLSEQSKIDITIGLIDIFNEDVRLSDYSMLLVPPYRGLERFIYDLQKAQGIEVKLIGQAFDKSEGNYTLKASYMRRIRSVIYNEVLSALYTEYFNKRNFYAHSDNSSDSLSRVITEKAQVKAIFEHLLALINYNGKKLKEIGFTVGS